MSGIEDEAGLALLDEGGGFILDEDAGAVAFRAGGGGSVTSTITTQLSAALPSGAQQNDLILIWCASVSAANSFSSPGFTAVPPAAGGGGQGTTQLLWKKNSAPDAPGTIYLITAAAADVMGQLCVAYGGEDQLIIFDGGPSSGAVSSAVSLTVSSQSLTLAYPGTRLAWFGFTVIPSGTSTITPPSGYITEVPQITSSVTSATQVALLMGDTGASAPGVTGTVSGSVTAAGISGATLLGIPPAQPLPQAGRRHRRPFVPRARRGSAVRGRGAPGVPYPVFSRTRPRTITPPRNWARSRIFRPPLAQAGQGGPWPVIAGSQRFRAMQAAWSAARFRRGRVFAPPAMSQGPLAPRWVPPPVTRPGWRRLAPRLRRSQVFTALPRPQASGSPWLTARRSRSRDAEGFRLYRRRVWAPRMAQGPLAAGTPPVMRPRARLRAWWFRRQGRVFTVTRPKMTISAAAALSAPSVLTAHAAVSRFASAALSAPSTMSARGMRGVPASAALTAPSVMTARAQALRIASASLTAPSVLTAPAVLARNGAAALSAPSTMTVAGSLSSSAVLSAPSRMTVTAVPVQLAAAALNAPSALTATATAGPRGRLITITPDAIPGVNEEPGTGDLSSAPVTGSTVTAQIEDGIYDDDPS
jgi:hypothetical protein